MESDRGFSFFKPKKLVQNQGVQQSFGITQIPYNFVQTVITNSNPNSNCGEFKICYQQKKQKSVYRLQSYRKTI